MKPNPVKRALQAGQTVIGSEISHLRSPFIPRIYAAAGFDFVFIDMEHSSFGLETVADMIQAARNCDIVPIVRVPQAEYPLVTRVLDAGALGVIVPRVNTPTEVKDIVSWIRYPPHGIRGFACTTAQTDGRPAGATDFIESNNRETLLVIQIERREALANLPEMLSIDGVDVACLGPMDLTVDLGIPGEVGHPSMVAEIERLIEISNENGVASGFIGADMETVSTWMSQGIRFVSFSTDELLLRQAATAASRQLRAIVEQKSNGKFRQEHQPLTQESL